MDKLIVLGSADAIPDMEHDTTHLLATTDNHCILIDCSGSTFQKLGAIEVPFESITDIIITHYHPDHVSGLPMLLMDMWLSGRKEMLRIHGLEITLNKIQAMMDLYDWNTWPGLYPVQFNVIPDKEMHPVLVESDLEIYASPTKHVIPSVGLRMNYINSAQSITYSSDTEPCEAVVNLAQDADVLIQETAGEVKGHSSCVQAADMAKKANAKNLYFIHYVRDEEKLNKEILEAQKIFSGPINLTADFMEFNLG